MATVTLQSCEGDVVEVRRDVITLCNTIKNMLDDLPESAGADIPLPDVSTAALRKVIEFCEHETDHPDYLREVKQDESRPPELSAWNKRFFQESVAVLFDMVRAVNYLDNQRMLALLCQVVADMMRGKSPEEIRSTFNIKNDFTPEEEEQIRLENAWCEGP